MLACDPANRHHSRFIDITSRKLDSIRIQPQGLGLDEIDPVLLLVGGALCGIELEVHVPI
ncbi:hypothetical protein DFR48_101194 [Ciceribacter lividus]|uniref:Uncharacterized protein n=1 Tax=Ciceribacter lividus TaxID=1197950 RepID=A0A6I7HTP5_9HYPH|nr:hypothetical protein DFR48_101194 [Ciceribacter lividus]